MSRSACDFRWLLLIAAAAFIYIQMRLFATQSKYADRLAAAVEAENHCTSQTRLFIDQISMQQGRIVELEEEKRRRDEETAQLRALVEALERKGVHRLASEKIEVTVAAVVVMACNRADYLERTIKSILKYHSSVASKYPLFISQDGSDTNVKNKALSYDRITYMQAKSVESVTRWSWKTVASFYLPTWREVYPNVFSFLTLLQPLVRCFPPSRGLATMMQCGCHLDYDPILTERPGELIAYYKIARHYKWALDELFYKHNFSKVVILEDDMEIAPDFFDYFEAGAYLLDKDRSIMAVSSWNDNGQKQFVHDPYALYRSDFFPGLGWMLSKSTWDELSPKWPKAYWDDWLRLKENHNGRQFIRPEICRTYNFGEHGSSLGQFFSQYLEPIKLNDMHVNWSSMNLSYLLENNFVNYFANLVRQATPLKGKDAALKANYVNGDVRIQYRDQPDFVRIALQFGIFEEWKDGIPRTAYKGVVVFRYRTPKRVFLVGPDSLRQLGIENS